MRTEQLPRRIVVIGTSGSGKTTLAGLLACRLGLAHVELDGLHWEPHWTQAALPVFRTRVAAALDRESWIVDGNYGKVRDLVWPRADTVVWLDYPLWLILWRLLRRTIRRVVWRESLWNGNRERLIEQFASRDSLFLWALRSHGRHRRDYPELLSRPECAHLTVVRLHSPRQTRRWLARLLPATLLEHRL